VQSVFRLSSIFLVGLLVLMAGASCLALCLHDGQQETVHLVVAHSGSIGVHGHSLSDTLEGEHDSRLTNESLPSCIHLPLVVGTLLVRPVSSVFQYLTSLLRLLAPGFTLLVPALAAGCRSLVSSPQFSIPLPLPLAVLRTVVLRH